MFWVRFSPCPAPRSAVAPSPARCVHRGRPPPPASRSHLAPHRTPSLRLSAARVDVQPAAEPRHLQRHRYGLHFLRALLPVACPQSAVELSPARRVIPRARALAPRVPWPLRACPGPLPSVVHARLRHRHSTPSRLPARTSPPALYALSTRQNTTSVSAANKLLIRCAWAGTSAFPAYYGPSWGPGSCIT